MQNIALQLSGTKVLEDIALTVKQGEFVSILGPSGAGKSTIFRLLTGALRPDRGSMICNGVPLDPVNQGFAFMPQRDALMPWRRIVDNVTLGLEVRGMSRKDARARVLPLFDAFGLSGFETRYPAELSGGMRQRAALLRTVVQDRPVLLLDEPFGALDALTRIQMQTWFERRWQESHWTTLLVTHDVREAVALSDRIYVLSRRPARVVAEVTVPARRPRLGTPITTEAHALEEQLLDILHTQTGDIP